MAEDATQAAYTVLWNKWLARHSLPFATNHKYVIGIAGKKVIDWYRASTKFDVLDDEFDLAVEDYGYEAILGALTLPALLDKVHELIDGQPPRRRAVAMLYFWEHRSYAEIAQMLGMAPSTARTHVELLRKPIRRLADHMFDPDQGGE